MIKTLNNLGININTIPVLDILRNNTNKVIGNRRFSKDKKIVYEPSAKVDAFAIYEEGLKAFELNISCIVSTIIITGSINDTSN